MWTWPISTCLHRQEEDQESYNQDSRSPSEIHVLEGELFSCFRPHTLPWLHGCHAARHAEGRGDGREDRNGGLNDEPPYLSFLFIHDFLLSFKGLINEYFLFLHSGSQVKVCWAQVSQGVKGECEMARGVPIVWRSSFSRRRGRVARGKPLGFALPPLRRAGGRVGGWCSRGYKRRGCK